MRETLHIYSRVSTRIQEDGTSLTTQQELGREKAKQLGMKAQVWNEGSASSNNEDLVNRPKLMELMSEVENGNVKHLFVFNNDRLSRNDITQQTIKVALQKNNVVLYTRDGQFDFTNPQDKLFKTVLDGIAAYDNALRAERSHLGKVVKVKDGYWYGAPPPYGYRSEGKRLVIDKEESKWVKKIFGWVYEGKPLIWVKQQLDANGVLARRGRLFSTGSLNRMLRNTHHIGYYYWTDRKSGNTIKCKCPPIVDEIVWKEVAKRREDLFARQKQRNRTKKFYLLRDLMVCGECGSNMSGRIKPLPRGIVQTYYCPKKEREWKNGAIPKDDKWKRGKVSGRGCGMNVALNIPITDGMVWELVMDVVSQSHMLKEEFKSEVLQSKFKSDRENSSLRKKEQSKQLRLNTTIERAKTSLAEIETQRILGEYDPVVADKVKTRVQREIEIAEAELEQSKVRERELSEHKKWLDWLDRYGEHLRVKTNLPSEQRKEYISGLVERIEVRLDKETLDHNLRVFFRMALVDDAIEYKNPKQKSEGYRVKEGKFDRTLVISRSEVLEIQNRIRRAARKKKDSAVIKLPTVQKQSTTVE